LTNSIKEIKLFIGEPPSASLVHFEKKWCKREDLHGKYRLATCTKTSPNLIEKRAKDVV
jgi:hypothetical protein